MAYHSHWGTGSFTGRGGIGTSIHGHIQPARTRCRNQLVASLPFPNIALTILLIRFPLSLHRLPGRSSLAGLGSGSDQI